MKVQQNNSILVIGDSLSFGRPKYNIGRLDTWPFLLSYKLDVDLVFRSNGGARISNAIHEARSLHSYWFDSNSKCSTPFDAIFIQIGLCDVAPRLVHPRAYPYFSRIPVFKKLERSRAAYKLFGKPWTSPDKFSNGVSELVNILHLMTARVFFLEIAPPFNYFLKNVGDFTPMVKQYNDILEQAADSSLITWCKEVDPSIHILPDGQHLTSAGHSHLTSKIIKEL